MKTVKGDLIQLALKDSFDVIIHGCNCFHTMGAGIAKFIKKEFPEAYTEDVLTVYGDKKKLGYVSIAHIEREGASFSVVNGYTQFDFKGKMNVDYEAIRNVFRTVKNSFREDVRIGYPLIGCGLAGGDWDIVSKIIEEELNGLDHTLVEFDNTKSGDK